MTWVDLGPVPEGDEELYEAHEGADHYGVASLAGGWVVFDLWCPHAECPLTDGWLEGAAIRCACHGGLFDLETGAALEGPTDAPLRLHRARVVAGRLEADAEAVSD